MSDLLHISNIEQRIFTMRGVQVMLDRDLAILYKVETRALKQAVKRNLARFPDDFMFELTEDEIAVLVSQSVIPSKQHLGGSLPFVFTEQGVATISSVLTSDRAIEVNIHIMRAFVIMRRPLGPKSKQKIVCLYCAMRNSTRETEKITHTKARSHEAMNHGKTRNVR